MNYSISSQLAIWAVRFYQKFISPYKGFTCPYGKLVDGEQSCSGFGMTALKSMPLSQALKEIKTRLHCCHEVNVLFSGKTCTSKKWGPYKTQGGFVDGDCGGGDCGSGPDCGDCGGGPDCGDCSGPSCDDCTVFDCGMFSSGAGSSASSDVVEFFLEVAADSVEAVAEGAKSVKNNTTQQAAAAAGVGVGAAIIANKLLKKKFVLVANLKNNKSIYRIDKETGCYLVDTDKAKEQLKTPKEFYVTEDEAKQIISNN